LVCLLSKPNGYNVLVISENRLFDPQEIVDWDTGQEERGMHHFLSPHNDNKGFSLIYVQTSDEKGSLISSGAILDYVFEDEKFEETYQTL
jgi:hypothetical protein